MDMSGVNARIEQSADRLVNRGLDLKDQGAELKGILADGKVDDRELARLHELVRQLHDLGEELLVEAVEVEDVALDIAEAKQSLTLGRRNTPNRHLQDREKRLELLKSLHDGGQRKAPTGRELVEANGHMLVSNRK